MSCRACGWGAFRRCSSPCFGGSTGRGSGFAVLCAQQEGEWADRVREMGVPLSLCRPRPLWNPLRPVAFVRAVARTKPSLVHIHNRPAVIPAATACRLLGGIPYAIHYQNDLGIYQDGMSRLLLAWERRLTLGAGALFAVSAAAAESNARGIGVPLESIKVVHNGVDAAPFASAEPCDPQSALGVARDRPIVVQVGRLIGFKAPEDFIRAAACVLRDWPGDAATRPAFVIVGEGPLRPQCEALVRELGLVDDCLLVGTREDVPAVLKASAVGVMASKGGEGFGLSLLEYVAAGLPVVATNIPCFVEALAGGNTGLLSPPSRPELLAANIRRVLLAPELGRTMARRAAQHSLPAYTWEHAAREWQAAYARMLGLPAGR